MSDKGLSNNMRGKHPSEDLIYNRLINAIIDKKLRPGHHLNEVKLAEDFNIPRSRVRRVLERLRDEELVKFKLHQGAFISRPTASEARHVFEARREVESIVIKLACERIMPEDLDMLGKLLDQEKSAFESRQNNVNRIAAEFHFTLGRIIANPVIERMLYLLVQRCILIQSIYEQRSGILCLTSEHAALLDCLARKDTEGAVLNMEHHINHIISSLDLTSDRHE